jgi:D-alanyl-D-alanine carboxypeptidase/D-alanyl-D-alanine-endopeptidase (penicillin-binding protein 4)
MGSQAYFPRQCSRPRPDQFSAAIGLCCALSLGGLLFGQEAGRAGGSDRLARRIDEVLATPGFEHGHWGILVVDAKSGQSIYERNADELFAPASVTKLFSTAAALIELGPGHRFHTSVCRRGEVEGKGVLRGDLILVAQGDLSLGGRTGPDGRMRFKDGDHTYAGGNLSSEIVETDPLAGLDELARQVRISGIAEIIGDVIVDDRLFASALATGSGPRQISPIVVNDNVADVLIDPAQKAGEPAKVRFRPETPFLTMDAQVATTEAFHHPELHVVPLGPRRFSVRGKLPLGHKRVVKIYEVGEPSSFARALFVEALRRKGVSVQASPLAANDTAGLPDGPSVAKLPTVATYTSPPFREYVRVTLKVSHNLYASTFPLLLAVQKGERTLAAGLKRQGEILTSLGVRPRTVSFGGGAGGDRADLASPRATVTLLRAMSTRPEFPAFDAGLPVLGRDGTLATAVPASSPASGHAHAKTGTYTVENALDGQAVLTSKALAGYLETASGRSLVFAAFVNNVPLEAPTPGRSIPEATLAAGRVLGRLCEVLYADSDTSTGLPPAAKAAAAGRAGR